MKYGLFARYAVWPRDWIFVKGYGFISFAKNMGKNVYKNISKMVVIKFEWKIQQKT